MATTISQPNASSNLEKLRDADLVWLTALHAQRNPESLEAKLFVDYVAMCNTTADIGEPVSGDNLNLLNMRVLVETVEGDTTILHLAMHPFYLDAYKHLKGINGCGWMTAALILGKVLDNRREVFLKSLRMNSRFHDIAAVDRIVAAF